MSDSSHSPECRGGCGVPRCRPPRGGGGGGGGGGGKLDAATAARQAQAHAHAIRPTTEVTSANTAKVTRARTVVATPSCTDMAPPRYTIATPKAADVPVAPLHDGEMSSADSSQSAANNARRCPSRYSS